MLRLSLRRAWLIFATFGALLFVSPPARAFERQWHLGGGLGFASPNGDYSTGPALGIYGAYGLSDVFDLRLELQSSSSELTIASTPVREEHSVPLWFHGARFGIAYKLDVIQWIPYGGVSAGGFVLASDGDALVRPSVGALVGLDYAVSRHFGLGVVGMGDYVFVDSAVTIVAGLVRAEYRFGW